MAQLINVVILNLLSVIKTDSASDYTIAQLDDSIRRDWPSWDRYDDLMEIWSDNAELREWCYVKELANLRSLDNENSISFDTLQEIDQEIDNIIERNDRTTLEGAIKAQIEAHEFRYVTKEQVNTILDNCKQKTGEFLVSELTDDERDELVCEKKNEILHMLGVELEDVNNDMLLEIANELVGR